MNKSPDETRKRFEELVFANYFISTIKRTGLGMCLEFLPDPERQLTKAEFCERDEKGNYKRKEVDAMWFGWKMAIKEADDTKDKLYKTTLQRNKLLKALNILRSSKSWFDFAGYVSHEANGKIYTVGDIITSNGGRINDMYDHTTDPCNQPENMRD